MDRGAMRFLCRFMAATIVALAVTASASAAPVETVLHSFTGGKNGAQPSTALIADANGALYGTASGGDGNLGLVFRLTPPAQGKTFWTETVLWRFKGGTDGGAPKGGLIADANGALYGTTTSAGGMFGAGTVFKLTPPAKGKTVWTETTLYSFTGGKDGGSPIGGLVADANGALYGAALNGGTQTMGVVFMLTPPAIGKTVWTETVLWNFTGGADGAYPNGDLLNVGGRLYGTAVGGGADGFGVAFQLTPPGEAWTETILHTFTGGSDGAYPRAGLMAGNAGFFGTTNYGGSAPGYGGFGVVFQLGLPIVNGQWTETTLHAFTGGLDGRLPLAGLWEADFNRGVYGTTFEGGINKLGVAFRLRPPAKGQTVWTEIVLENFGGNKGSAPTAGLLNVNGILYGTTPNGGAYKNGVVFKLTP